MAFPTLTEVKEYLELLGLTEYNSLGTPSETLIYTDAQIADAMAAEKSSQASICKVPATDEEDWPADLVAAFKRRVARHLKMGSVVLGVMMDFDNGFRISGLDAETRRLEAPYKRIRSFGV